MTNNVKPKRKKNSWLKDFTQRFVLLLSNINNSYIIKPNHKFY